MAQRFWSHVRSKHIQTITKLVGHIKAFKSGNMKCWTHFWHLPGSNTNAILTEFSPHFQDLQWISWIENCAKWTLGCTPSACPPSDEQTPLGFQAPGATWKKLVATSYLIVLSSPRSWLSSFHPVRVQLSTPSLKSAQTNLSEKVDGLSVWMTSHLGSTRPRLCHSRAGDVLSLQGMRTSKVIRQGASDPAGS